MKLIFLDFDGVLNHVGSPKAGGLLQLDPECVEILNRILSHQLDAQVVISSSWRVGKSLQELRDLLLAAGLRTGHGNRIIDVTPQTPHCRGNEILTWLTNWGDTPEAVLILDDDSDMGALKPCLLKTNMYSGGLKEEHLAAAFDMLKRPFRPEPPITQILLDMDGVIADFCTHAILTFGKDPSEVYRQWRPGHYEIHEVLGLPSADFFWSQVNRYGHEWWSSIPHYSWASELWNVLEAIAPITILTSPSRNPNAAKGKVRWLLNWKGSTFRSYMIGPQKYLCARQGALLVDDTESKVKKFTIHGGHAILFPRLWNDNHEYADDPIGFVRRSIDHGQFYVP